MDIEKLLKWGTEYLSDYVAVFVVTLRSPTSRFQPIVALDEQSRLASPTTIPSSYAGPNLNPKLFGFLIISVFLGATLNSLVPRRPASPDVATTLVVTLVIWFVYSVTVYVMCKVLRGKASFWETVSVALQLLAVIYVVGNFVAFVWGVLAQLSIFRTVSNPVLALLVQNPIFIYYIIQFALMFVYLPIAIKNLQGFGVGRQILVTIIPIFWTLFAAVGFLESGQNTYVVYPCEACRAQAELEALRRSVESQRSTQTAMSEYDVWIYVALSIMIVMVLIVVILLPRWRSKR